MDDGLVGVSLEQGADRTDQGRAVTAGQVDAADRSLEEDIAGEDRLLAADRVGDVPGAVAGGEDDVELESGQLQHLAAGHGLVGLVALVWAETLPGDESHDVGEHGDLDDRAVDRGAGCGGDRGDGADVVEVAVGEQDCLDRPDRAGGGEDPLCLLTGIDDEDTIRTLATQQEAVLGERADGEHLDLESHRI